MHLMPGDTSLLDSNEAPPTIALADVPALSDAEVATLISSEPKVFFLENSAKLDDSALRVLDKVAALLLHNPKTRVQVIGLSDELLSSRARDELALYRGFVVQSYLLQWGVSSKQLTPLNFKPTYQRPAAGASVADRRKAVLVFWPDP